MKRKIDQKELFVKLQEHRRFGWNLSAEWCITIMQLIRRKDREIRSLKAKIDSLESMAFGRSRMSKVQDTII